MTDLISDKMLQANRELHARDGYGGSGWKQAEAVVAYAQRLCARSILDYGCGEGTLRMALGKGSKKRSIVGMRWKGKVFEYDPAFVSRNQLVKSDLVVCTDVLEHVEPKLLDNVLAHARGLTRKGAFFVVATRFSNKLLPDGRNVHLVVKGARWWVRKIGRAGFVIDAWEERRRKGDDGPHSVVVWARK
jgi:2-polyprenyl-3-methyl-5-hydroxy-6-metoxy-1,4-benzoquinol methylase